MGVVRRSWRGVAAGAIALLAASGARAHETRPAYLGMTQTGPETYDVVWKVPARSQDLRLPVRVVFPRDTVDVTPPRGALAEGTYAERWSVRRPGGLGGQIVTFDGLSAGVTDVLVRIEHVDGATQLERVLPERPSFVVAAQPGRLAVALSATRLGIDHILHGFDHLLFVLGLILIVPDFVALLKTVTAFTIAHSLTLAAAALGYASAPRAPVEAAIALSILFLGPEIVRARRGETSAALRAPWIIAFAFGLLHGFGFASGLSTTGLPASAIPVTLLFFNVGVELGQLAFVGAILGLAAAMRWLGVRWPAWVAALPAYTVGTLGAYWTIQRTAILLAGPR